MVTSDLDIIQEIFIKQYANFSARKVIKFTTNISKVKNEYSLIRIENATI